jgi:bifunctional ADP-heptose synthase (sugar kinase/adenylyltransferase)
MVVAGGGETPLIIPARPQTKVADATGAGDTVAAAVTVGLLGGASFVEAALLSELAARVVVRRLGVAVPSIDEILIEAGRDS